jgi:type I restriction enzyme, S subunit
VQIQKTKKVHLSKLPQSKLVTIPQDWTVKQFHEIAEINPEVIGKKYSHKEILYVDIGAIDDFQINNFKLLSLDSRPSRAQRIIKKNDIIVSTVRPYLKGFAKIKNDKPNLVCSTGFTVIRAKNKEDSELIFQVVKGKFFETNIFRQMDGLAYPAVSSSVVGNSLLAYSKESKERNKICLILSNMDKLISSCNDSILITKKLKQGLIQKILTKGIGHKKFKRINLGLRSQDISIPESWDIEILQKLSDPITKGATPTTYGYEWSKSFEDILFIRNECVKKNEFQTEGSLKITNEAHEFMKRSKIIEGDLLLSITGEIGKTCLFPKNQGEANINQHIARIRINSKKIIIKYVLNILNSYKYTDYFYTINQGLTHPHLNLEQVRNTIIPIPSKKEQEKIVSILNSIDFKLSKIKSKKAILENRKKGLMQKVLTGQIRV